MSGIIVDHDIKELIVKLKQCEKEIAGKQISREIIKFAADEFQELRKEVLTNLKQSVRIRGYSISSIKYGKMDKGIQIVRGKINSIYAGRIHIMGDYRLKWFERGTDERYKKKSGAFTGKIKATHFFSKVSENPAITEALRSSMIQKMQDLYSRLLESTF